jgi:hypothetical protein
MTKLVETNERITIKDQLGEEKIEGQVILINKFNVKPNKVK